MPSIRIRSQLLFPALTLVTLTACARSETTTSTPASAVSVANAEASAPVVTSNASAHAFHYDLALTITEGATTQKTSFTLDVSDRIPGAVTIGKNVPLTKGTAPGFAVARSDVGTSVKARLAMEGDVPRLDVEANVSSLDAKGTIHRSANKVLVATPLETPVVLVDKTEDGRQTRLTATAHAGPSLGAPAPAEPIASHVLDVAVVQSAAGVPSKTTNLTLTLTGDTPAIARNVETIPLSVVDGGAGVSPRQDTGTRVKATARPRASGVELDFDFEMSAGEPSSTSAMTIRKITARGPVLAPFDKTSTVFVADDDGRRYEVTVLPHR